MARRELAKRGLLILTTNWRSAKFEGDIIAADRRDVVIVEVKTRHYTLQKHFPAKDAVDSTKMKHLSMLGARFIRSNGPLCRRFKLRSFRVDVVEVYYRTIFGPLRTSTSVRWHRGLARRTLL